MTHPLDTLPLDLSDPAIQELRNLLADTFFRDNQVLSLVRAVHLRPAEINWNQAVTYIWDDLLVKARNQLVLRDLLNAAVAAERGIGSRIAELTAAQPVVAAPPQSGEPGWQGFDDTDALERIIRGESTLLDVAFLQRGTDLARAVCRLLVTLGGQQMYGTGFRIGPDLLLTNHHVLLTKAGRPASAVEAWFGYEKSFDGGELVHTSVTARADTIVGAVDHDWAVVRLDFPDGVPIIPLTGAGPVDVDDRVYIIQHPNGGVKKIGMVHNVVRYADDDVIQYWTDTEGGSSGSPVFNESWELVALHHKYVTSTTATGREYRNQGQRIQRVLEGLGASGVAVP